MDISIVLAIQHRLLREGMRMLLSSKTHLHVIGEAETGRQLIKLVRDLTPDIVIMDVGLPELNGMDATRQLVTLNPCPRIIGLSTEANRRQVFTMFQAGAFGFLLKSSGFEELLHAIMAVTDGKYYVSPAVADIVITEMLNPSREAASEGTQILTPREREVLQLLAEGKTSKETAVALSLTVNTVETYRRQLMTKLDLHNIAELTRYAIREGITPL